MRVHELAKACAIESKEVLAIAKKHRIAIKPSPSANIEDKDIRRLMPHIDKWKADQKDSAELDKRKKAEELAQKEEQRRLAAEKKRQEADAKRAKEEEDRLKVQAAAEAKLIADVEADRRKKAEVAEAAAQKAAAAAAPKVVAPKAPAAKAPAAAPEAPAPTPVAPAKAAPVRPAAAAPAVPPAAGAPAAAPGATPQQQSRTQPRPSPGLVQRHPQGTPGSVPGGQRPDYRGGQGAPGGQRPDYRGGQGGPGGQRPDNRGGQGAPGGQRPDYRGGQGAPGAQRPDYRGGTGAPGGQRPDYRGGQGAPGGQRPDYRGGQGAPGGQRPDYRGGQGGPGGPGGQRPDYRGGQGAPGGQRPDYRGGQGGPGGQRPDYRGGQGGPGGQRTDYRGGQQGGPDRRGPRPEGGRDVPLKMTTDMLPQITVMADKGRGPARGGVKPVKKGADRKKPRPTKIFELDEDITQTTRPGKPAGGRVMPGRSTGRRQYRKSRGGGGGSFSRGPASYDTPRTVSVQGILTVGQFADKISVPYTEVMKKMLMVGEMLSVNQNITRELMEMLSNEFNVDLDIIREDDAFDWEEYQPEEGEEKLVRRPPVVTIMGHVDHGKTSLLDYVRKSKVVDDEFGGITQHIGAYHVNTSRGDIVFLDTPGHEAFTSMRARGASVTDLVILVVAANDGFMPQTIEAIHHAQAGNVPIVVAVNKIDLPSADPAKTRQEGLQHNLISEEFGGETMFVDISAKFGTNVDTLLEMVALQAEILDLKADPDRVAEGTVIESHMDPLRGPVATLLVQKGTLRLGDAIVMGDVSGNVRAMSSDVGRPVESAGPSFPVEVMGLEASPLAGEPFLAVPDEQIAREIAEKRLYRRRLESLTPVAQKHVTLEGLHEMLEEGKTKELNIILKGDVQGSIEAISQSIEKLSTNQVRLKVLHSAVGGVNESDVNLAMASDAIIIGFNVRPESRAAELAEHEGVDIKLYRIIYDLVEEIRNAMVGMLDPKFREKVMGHAQVLQIFKASRIGTIAGCVVRDGEIAREHKVRVVRDSIVVYDGQLASLKRLKDDVRKVTHGLECGLAIERFNDIKEGDMIEAYMMEQVAATLDSLNEPTA